MSSYNRLTDEGKRCGRFRVPLYRNSVRTPSHVLADNGYLSGPQIEAVEADDGPIMYVATGKTKHGRTVRDVEKKEEPPHTVRRLFKLSEGGFLLATAVFAPTKAWKRLYGAV